MIEHGHPFIIGDPLLSNNIFLKPVLAPEPQLHFLPQPMVDPVISAGTMFSMMSHEVSSAVTTMPTISAVGEPKALEVQESAPDDSHRAAYEEPHDVKSRARQWAVREGFNSDKLTEFGHLMAMVSSTYIPKHKLSKLIEIDSGSFGKIYKTRYDGAEVAVKQMSNNGESTIAAKMRELLLELRVLVRIRHPNVVTFWGTATEFPADKDSTVKPYIGLVFELCAKGSLHAALFEDATKPTLPQRVRIAHQCALGLSYLHAKKVIHRDINPRNILLSADGAAKIADFGCARVLAGDARSLKTTTISGSPAYMAPEQFQGQDLTEAVDTWALGCMLWEMMTLQKPWEGRFNDFALLKAAIVRGEKLQMPHSTRFPLCYVNMIKLGTQTLPRNRPSMAYIASELEKALAKV